MIAVSVGEEPSVHVGLFLTGQLSQSLQKIRRIKGVSAVDNYNLTALIQNNKAHHLCMCIVFKHPNAIFHFLLSSFLKNFIIVIILQPQGFVNKLRLKRLPLFNIKSPFKKSFLINSFFSSPHLDLMKKIG
jgi:hypothetical protein